MDYAVFDTQGKRFIALSKLSVLMFRPESPIENEGGMASSLISNLEFSADKPRAISSKVSEAALVVRSIEKTLVMAQMFAANGNRYAFAGDNQNLSLVTRLPDFFPRNESLDGFESWRLNYLLDGRNHSDLVVEYAPFLMDTDQTEPARIVLARNLTAFELQYWDAQRDGWTDQWISTNALPTLVRIALGLRPQRGSQDLPHQLVSRLVALPSTAVGAALQDNHSLPIGPIRPPVLETNIMGPHRPFAFMHPDATASYTAPKVGTQPTENTPQFRLSQIPVHDTQVELMNDIALEWLGRSGVELARYVLSLSSLGIAGSFNALNQIWAGGTNGFPEELRNVGLVNVPLGNGRFSIEMIDLDRKFNINTVDPFLLDSALLFLGVEWSEIPTVVDSILDWRDTDSNPRPNGAEEGDYLSTPNPGLPPSFCKNGPIDHLSELRLVRGISESLLWGESDRYSTTSIHGLQSVSNYQIGTPSKAIGLADFFTPVSGRLVNINTASALTLQVLPGIDANVAQAILAARAGADGIEGNEDDTPFRSPQEVALRVPGFYPVLAQQLARYFTVRSVVFETHVFVELGDQRREFVALLYRSGPSDVGVVSFR